MPTLRQARQAFFHASGFPADGGYDDEVAEADFGLVRYRVKNGPLRREALKLHDLHHLATGYGTDWRGEAEISAWELASGFGRQPYAWIVMLWGLFTGLVMHPEATFRAFVRGRGSRNLYGRRFDASWLDRSVAELRAHLRVGPEREARLDDLVAFAAWSLAAVAYGLLALPATVLTIAWALVPRCPLRCAHSVEA